MAATKKDRYIDGVKLADNLYPDPRGRAGYFRYMRPNRTFKTFEAESVERANEIAEEANAARALWPKPAPVERGSTLYGVQRYIAHREKSSPSLKRKDSWRNRKYAMKQFAEHFPDRADLSRPKIAHWWHGLTHSQQILRQAEFRKMFNYWMQHELVRADYNPFTLSWDQPRLLLREQDERKRQRLTIEQFWTIYDAAPEGVKIAMGISLVTTMRRSDVLTLEHKRHVQGRYLRKVISKSEERTGKLHAARLQWKLDDHPLLAELVERGARLAAVNGKCPYIVSHKPKRRVIGKAKSHPYQLLPNRLTQLFDEIRKQVGIKGPNPPTFHEVRSLGSKLYADAGFEITDIQQLMAHSDETMTRLYHEGHELPWQEVKVSLMDVGRAW